ncbi:MAG: hypothetical protein EAZ42_04680 [Verrucomicrobia bacterium]|nr:MAG: hypothetical protein EAZ42_04680 [Verrucomicrobiota bacterium]
MEVNRTLLVTRNTTMKAVDPITLTTLELGQTLTKIALRRIPTLIVTQTPPTARAIKRVIRPQHHQMKNGVKKIMTKPADGMTTMNHVA